MMSAEATASKKQFDLKKFLINNGIICVLIILAVITGILQPTFATPKNFMNIAINAAPRFIVAIGVSGCLITKGTDLSAGRQVGLAACIAGTLLQKPDYAGKFFPNLPDFGAWWIVVVLLICIAVCALLGLLNGIVISYLQVPAFICTLGTQLIVYGICLVYTNATPIGGYRTDYSTVTQYRIFDPQNGLPIMFVYAFVIGLLMWFVYNKMPHGKYMYAIGGNEQAAEVSGVNTNKTKIIIYVTAAVMYAIGGFLVGGKSGGSSVNMGQGWELEAIAACTIGGVSVNGGIGKVSGVLIGVLVFEILKTCLQYLGVNTNYQYIAQGVVIVVAIALDIRKYIQKK